MEAVWTVELEQSPGVEAGVSSGLQLMGKAAAEQGTGDSRGKQLIGLIHEGTPSIGLQGHRWRH